VPSSAFEYFVGQENRKVVRLLEENRDISQFFMSLLDHLVKHCEATGTSFRDLQIQDPYVSPDGYIRARVR
jgi:hypothetical protein